MIDIAAIEASFAEQPPDVCPICGNDRFWYDDFEGNEEGGYINVICDNCNWRWSLTLIYAGMCDLHSGEDA